MGARCRVTILFPNTFMNWLSRRLHRCGRGILMLAVILLLASQSFAATNAAPGNGFDAANSLYYQGRFADAAEEYRKIAASGGGTANLWFNLGNAHYKANEIGRAIAAYRMAERLDPRDSALRANLQFVRGKVYSDDRAHVPWWKNAVRLATLNEWTILTTALLWASFSVLACSELAGRRYAKTAITFLIFTLLSGGATAAAWKDWQQTEAVVIAREAVVRFGPVDVSQQAFQLRDGVELSVRGAKDDWLEVRDPENRSGWIRRDEVVVLR